MIKLVDKLSTIFGFRITRDEEIPAFITRMAGIGKFDQPRQNKVITELLVRVAELETRMSLIEDQKYIEPMQISTPIPELQIKPEEERYEDLVNNGGFDKLMYKGVDLIKDIDTPPGEIRTDVVLKNKGGRPPGSKNLPK